MEGNVCMFCAVLVGSDLDCKYFKHSCHCPWSPELHPSPFPPLLTLVLLYPAQSLSLLISPVCSHSWLVEIPRVVPPSCSRNFKHLLLISQSPQQYLRTGFSSPLLPDCSASSGGDMRLAGKKLHFWFHALTLFLVCLKKLLVYFSVALLILDSSVFLLQLYMHHQNYLSGVGRRVIACLPTYCSIIFAAQETFFLHK